MTIFDKLSGFAQRARDNALTRSILSKDRRLEKNLSESLDPSAIGLLPLASYGLPATISATAFDPVSGLLAIAGGSESSTFIRIFGKGLSSPLTLQSQTRIKYIVFKTGYPLLVAVDMKNVIVTYDLRSKRPQHAVKTPSIITCLEYLVGTHWLLVGFADGNVDVFNTSTGQFSSEYGIPDLVQLEKEQAATGEPGPSQQQSIVVALQMHPSDLNTVLIGYETGVYMWNIRDQTIRRTFGIGREQRVTCLTWSPCGQKFMIGYDDGSMHLWDIRNDQRPLFSRRVFQACPSSSPQAEPCEPIYQLAWYLDQAKDKSYLIASGGSDLPDIKGLHVMEFNGSDNEARKQTILPTPVDVAEFVLLSSEPYYLGMRNPLGIAVLGSDGALRSYGLDHGYPLLTPPPAMDFLNPPVARSFYISQIPEHSFRMLTSVPPAATHYLPLTGGAAGAGHIYRFPSNDILITIHAGEVIRFWDASFTGLRPLPHLTIDCRDHILEKEAYITRLEFDPATAALYLAFSNQTLLKFNFKQDATSDPSIQQTFVDNCDDTLKEISELLDDMNRDETQFPQKEVPEAPMEDTPKTSSPAPAAATDVGKAAEDESGPERIETEYVAPVKEDPAETAKNKEQAPVKHNHAEEPVLDEQSSAADEKKQTEPFPIHVECLYSQKVGYVPTMKVHPNGASVSLMAADERDDLLALATTDGHVYVINAAAYRVVFAKHPLKVTPPKAEDEPEQEVPSQTVAVTCLKLLHTYSSSNMEYPTPQLFIGYENGSLYQYDLSSTEERYGSEHDRALDLPFGKPILDLLLFNVEDAPQQTSPTGEETIPSHQDSGENTGRKSQDSKEDDGASGKSSDKSLSLLRKTTRKFSVKQKGRKLDRDGAPPLPGSVHDEAAVGAQDEETGRSGSKRVHAKVDYQPQADPHLLVMVTPVLVSVFLSGCAVRLFQLDLQEVMGNDRVVVSRIAKIQTIVCLVTVMQSGAILVNALPTLEPIAKVNLPAEYLLREVSLSGDGRVTAWSARFELQQILVLLQNEIPNGESVMLHDNQIRIPPHPTAVAAETAQKTKKSWLDTVQTAFQKGPVTVPELNTLFGKQEPLTREQQHQQQRQQLLQRPGGAGAAGGGERHTNSTGGESSSSGLGGVFKELGNKMNERGERLNQLETKFQDMNDASNDFLKAVRDLNERQAKKKWWEF